MMASFITKLNFENSGIKGLASLLIILLMILNEMKKSYSNSIHPLGIFPMIDKPYFPFKSNIYETKVPKIIYLNINLRNKYRFLKNKTFRNKQKYLPQSTRMVLEYF